MRRRTMLAGGFALAGAAAGGGSAGPARAAGTPVVLELFTSQGCSSCPPADALLGRLTEQPEVIGLAWHVDYWNGLGWADPYASRQWTERQRRYAHLLREDVYTPALVVNGAAMVVGSNAAAVAAAMRRAEPPTVTVQLARAGSGAGSGAGVTVELGPLPASAAVMLATYDAMRTTPVRGGENGGRVLKEYRVVRTLRALPASAGRHAVPDLPATQGTVVLVQDGAWRVLGAADLRPDA